MMAEPGTQENSILLLDVDDTLYPRGTGPFNMVNERIDHYVMRHCSLGPEQAKILRRTYISTYGSTLRGLMRHFNVDPGHYLMDVHDVPVHDMLHQDIRLRETLQAIPCEMIVFSNGSVEYVRRVLTALGVDDLVCSLFTIEYMDYIPKPLAYPYHKIMALYERKPEDCIVVDDRPSNIKTAEDLGMAGILVGDADPPESVVSVREIYDVHRVLNLVRTT
ncbi:MAG: pyrimidine 5'-nucleotidase [Desulfomonilia bacterium]|nr:pyrimidine 5'-nucleotidase [Desulfomonilia bacterium]